ncbi:MAG: acyl carrier protein [Butyrivibrio sp.]|nr:acyl carrier protein [Butyrivibrio sp.]
MERLIELLEEIKEDIDFENTMDLIDGGILDSFDILQIIGSLNDEFDISIPASEIVPQNFNSAKALWKMVQRLQDEA